MNKQLLLIICTICSLPAMAQPLGSQTSVGYPPINDLGTGTWRGVQGGLYANGSNQRPTPHNLAGIAIARQIQPLNAAGMVDTANGKIVWLSVGMSNTTQETQAFIPLTDTLSIKNPKLQLVDGAQGGQDINIIINPSDPFWTTINSRLQQAGLTPAQVQVIWFKQAEKNPTDTAFATYPDALKAKFKIAMRIIKAKFPNAKLCYLTSRIYAGYASSTLNPEPYAWYSGWSVKRLIQDQISGDTSLAFAGPNARAPWLSWGPYPWADGTTPRLDGLTWVCPGDYISDGTHPSTAGRQKIANMLLQLFTTDATATPWFLKAAPMAVASHSPAAARLQIYPQPAGNLLTVSFPGSMDAPSSVVINDLEGRVLRSIPVVGRTSFAIDISSLPPGMYWMRAGSAAAHFVKE
jgi:hypothetical protein